MTHDPNARPPQLQPWPQQQPAAGSTTTKWVWLAIACQALALVLVACLPWNLYIDGMTQAMSGASGGERVGAAMISQFTMWSLGVSVVSMIASAGFCVCCYLDWRDLGRLGVAQPFHWAFALLGSLVYMIGRSVVLKSRGRPSWAPLWVTVVLQAVGLTVSVVIVVVTFQLILESVSQYR